MSRRPPRFAYWLAGAAIAFGGALGARFAAEQLPSAFQVPVWLTGGAIIFIGLAVLSLGTRHREEQVNDGEADASGERAVIDTPVDRRRRHNGNGNGNDGAGDGGSGGGGNGGGD